MTSDSFADASPNDPLLSVRGESSRFVDPDLAELNAAIEVTRDTQRDAVEATSDSVESVRRDLQRLGGVVREASSLRHPLTWSTRRVTTSPEWDHATQSPSGRIVGSASMSIYVRDFALLGAIERLATDVPGFQLNQVVWEVDPENATWREVRLAAIAEALRKGRDYAEALGSQLHAVEHVADLGLLDAAPNLRFEARAHAGPGFPGAFARGGSDTATLDPVPLQLTAAVEARFRMAPVPLAGR